MNCTWYLYSYSHGTVLVYKILLLKKNTDKQIVPICCKHMRLQTEKNTKSKQTQSQTNSVDFHTLLRQQLAATL
jgi:hypothetical protein